MGNLSATEGRHLGGEGYETVAHFSQILIGLKTEHIVKFCDTVLDHGQEL